MSKTFMLNTFIARNIYNITLSFILFIYLFNCSVVKSNKISHFDLDLTNEIQK